MAEMDNCLCHFCSKGQSKYSCSRCRLRFCSSECYRSRDHIQCSEHFFKQCVTQELLSQRFDDSSKRKFLDILQRNDKQFLDDLIANEDKEDVERDEENEESFDFRFNDLNIDDSTDVWNKLNDSERKQFNELLKSGQIGQFVELWRPWWSGTSHPLVIPLDESTSGASDADSDPISKVPPMWTNISQLKDLISVGLSHHLNILLILISNQKPLSPSVCPSVVNTLLSYCYVCRLFNGEYDSIEAIQTFINKCPQLSHNIVCNEVNKSLEMAVQQILVEQPSSFAVELLRDVKALINGPKIKMTSFESLDYVLRALSDLILIIDRNKRKVSKHKRKDLKLDLIAKKLEFFLSWSVPNGRSLLECLDQIDIAIDTLLLSEESHGLAEEPNEDLRSKLKPKTLIEEIN